MYVRLKELREEAQLSQSEVAYAVRIAQQTYSNYEIGKHDVPTRVLVRLARLYGTTVDYILGTTSYRGIPEEMSTSEIVRLAPCAVSQ